MTILQPPDVSGDLRIKLQRGRRRTAGATVGGYKVSSTTLDAAEALRGR